MRALKVAGYGSWKSPVTSKLIVSESVKLGQIVVDGGDIYWIESRPGEGGRNVVVRHTPDDILTDMIPAPYNARTRVHEYGGGAFAVRDATLYFINFQDQRLYRQEEAGQPVPITPETPSRYADLVPDQRRGRLICVREDHGSAGTEAKNSLAAIALDGGGDAQVLVSGNDFYSSPRLSPDGCRLAWLTWNHPTMPWDGTELWVGELESDGSIGRSRRIAGGTEESILQPEWSPDGTLYFVSERTGWWNLYRWRGDHDEPVCPMAAEFGRPQWVFAMSAYDFVSSHRIVCTYTTRGMWHLASLHTDTGTLEEIETPYTEVAHLRASREKVVFWAASPTAPAAVVELDPVTRGLRVLRASSTIELDAAYVSIPEALEFSTEGGQAAHAFFYPPRHPDFKGPAAELPPLLVRSHGGPTAAASSGLAWEVQYWTSRGIAVLDVNYGGSTGYGRDYRRRLDGRWGVVDAEDCVNAALHLVRQGRVDGDRLAIRGSSAGGYTTLCALTFHDVFKAGASYYGISDLEALTKDTHKFEAHYLDGLVGPYPERRDLYRERSPIHFTQLLSCPLILFQGLEDRVVPPTQAELMVAALRASGLAVAYLCFDGEQHGFRRAETIKRTLDAELYFYARVFGFDLAEEIEPVPIENL
jgi:dipeptidyl aminopeptidase/acylaminoacyl peptidase